MIFDIIYKIILLCWGLLCSITGFYKYHRLNIMKNWPQTMGKILSKSIIHSMQFGGGGRTDSLKTIFTPKIKYNYEVNSKNYISEQQLKESRIFRSKKSAERITKTYKEGENVIVNYSPIDPSKSYIQLTGRITYLIIFMFGLVLIALSLLIEI